MHPDTHSPRPQSFTLIELLVVVSIISVLAAMLLPALQRAKMRVSVTVCANTQKQAYLAIAMYGGDQGEYPATGSRLAYSWPTMSTPSAEEQILEKDGYGLGAFTTQGPYQLLVDGKYADSYSTLQCPARPFALSDRRNGWQQWGVPWVAGSVALWGRGTWFGYNGPNVYGPSIFNYGANGGLALLGGHHPWIADSWGLSVKDGSSHRTFNSYRSGVTSVEQVAFLACPGMVESKTENQWDPVAQREPHMDAPRDYADDYGNTTSFQTDGPIWTSANTWQVSRNYTFGDGHAAFIYRNNRAFSTADSF